MKVVWTFIAVICVVAAAVALRLHQLNVAFVIATLGIMAWFLRYRSELKETIVEDRSTLADDSEADSADENS